MLCALFWIIKCLRSLIHGVTMKNCVMCNLGLHFNVWNRGGGGSEHVSARTCNDSVW